MFKLNVGFTFGRSFVAIVSLRYESKGFERDCTLKWEEKVNRVSFPDNPDPNEWVDKYPIVANKGISPTLDPWDQQKSWCRSLEHIVLHDEPTMGLARYKRILDIRITVQSASNCGCRYESKTVEARQVLDAIREQLVEQTFYYGVEPN